MIMITSKKIIASMIILVLLIGMILPTFAATTVTGSATVSKNTILLGKDKSSQLAEIYAGQNVKITAKDGNYYYVTWKVTGYAHKNYINSSTGAIKGEGPNIYSDSNAKNKIGDLKTGKVTILDNKKLYGKYYRVSFEVYGYINKSNLKNINTNESKKTSSSSSSSNSSTSIIGDLLTIAFKGIEFGAEVGGSIFRGLLLRVKETPKAEKELTLNKASISIKKGNTEKITATYNGRTVKPSYKSSNTNIATVDSYGNVKGIKQGSTKITATYNGKKATCNVKVTDSTNSYTYTYNGDTYKIAVDKNRLDTTLSIINEKGLIQKYEKNNPKKWCAKIANYHIKLLLNQADGNITLEEIANKYNEHGNNSGGDLKALKKCIDDKKPARLHVTYKGYGEHWVTVVGYKNNGTKFSDFLIISTRNGNLINGGSTNEVSKIYSSANDTIRTFN